MIEIEDRRRKNLVQYGDVGHGRFFIYETCLCFKTEHRAYEVESGYVVDIDDDELTEPVDVKVVIE